MGTVCTDDGERAFEGWSGLLSVLSEILVGTTGLKHPAGGVDGISAVVADDLGGQSHT